MMNLKLDIDPMPGHIGFKKIAGTADLPPKPTTQPQPPEERRPPGPFFAHLPKNACDVMGCKKYGHAFPSEQALADHKRAAHERPAQLRQVFEREKQNLDAPAPAAAPATEAQAHKEFKCQHCSATFENRFKFAAHVRQHTPPSAPNLTVRVGNSVKYICPHCPHLSSTKQARDNHIERMHGNPPPERPGAPQLPQEETMIETPPLKFTKRFLASLPSASVTCPECHRPGSRIWLSQHFAKCHKGKVLQMDTDPFYCSVCAYSSYSQDAIYQHGISRHPDQHIVVMWRQPSAPPVSAPASPSGFLTNTRADGMTHYARVRAETCNIEITGTLAQVISQAEQILKAGLIRKIELGII